MVNVAVLNLKDIIKFGFKLIIVVAIVFAVTKFSDYIEQNTSTDSLDKTIPAIMYFNNTKSEEMQDETELEEEKSFSFIEYILNTQLAMKNNVVKKQEAIIEEAVSTQEYMNIPTDVETQVMQENNIPTTYTNTYNSVEIKNSSKYQLTEEILTPNIELSNKKDILIFHTHTCESYTPSEKFPYEMTGTYRTTDLNYSVSRVGDELEKFMTNMGYHVLHDKTVNDYPAYTGSYTRSLNAVTKYLENEEETQIVFDLHRDAVGSNNDYAPTVKIGDEYAAQIMFVIGTDGGGLYHPNWQQNLKFAVKVQQKANELYPGLFRPIILRDSRYNQHVTKAATIIEIGATGNTLDQCLTSMKYFSHILDEVLKE